MDVIEKEIESVLNKFCSGLESLQSKDSTHFYSAIYPSFDLFKPRIENLRKESFADNQSGVRPEKKIRALREWELAMYLKIEDRLRNTRPASIEEKQVSPEIIVQNFVEPSKVDVINKVESPQVIIEAPTEYIQKEVDYQDCLKLYSRDPEQFRIEVISILPEYVDAEKNVAEWVRNLNSKGVITYLKTLPEFNNQTTALAKFLKKTYNLPVAVDTIRNSIVRNT